LAFWRLYSWRPSVVLISSLGVAGRKFCRTVLPRYVVLLLSKLLV
jgi:hypothetical protein